MIFFKRMIVFSLLLFMLLFVPTKTLAVWYQYSNNPVLVPSENSWDSSEVWSINVINHDNQFNAWYQGKNDSYWQFGYATSNDGINWTKYSQPVLTPDNVNGIYETNIDEPNVIKTDGQYQMWYKFEDGNDNNKYKIRYATSADGKNWTKYPQIVLTGEVDWESKGVADPYVIKVGTEYWMYYNGWKEGGHWQIGLAKSADGISWTKYEGNPLTLNYIDHAGKPSVVFDGEKFHLFYHTGGTTPVQINHVVSADGLKWDCLECPAITNDSGIYAPSAVLKNGRYYLWYGNLKNISLASDQPFPENTPIPTANPTPTAILTPTPAKKNKIIIIPGMFASWNKEAIIYNQLVPQSNWQINPFVKEYNGLIASLNLLGYQINQDVFVFNYDWRKSLNSLTADFKSYIDSLKNSYPNEKFDLVGHSLGGLIGRSYLQNDSTETMNQLITIGTPHKGTPQAYKATAGGEIDQEDSFIWLAQQTILQINRNGWQTDRQVINEKMPIIKDLIPTYPFLTNHHGLIPLERMKITNLTLGNLENQLNNISEQLFSLAGQNINSPYGYRVVERTNWDKFFDLYPDGHPINIISKSGDGIITDFSALIGTHQTKIDGNHGEIISGKTNVKKILRLLDIVFTDNQVVGGQGTKITPSLIFLVFSPVTLTVSYQDQSYDEYQGLIYIDQVQTGQYLLKANGNEIGPYRIIIGQLTENGDNWNTIYGQIKKVNQEDSYTFDFNSDHPFSFPIDRNNIHKLVDQLISYLQSINHKYKQKEFSQAIELLIHLNLAHRSSINNQLLLVQQKILLAIKKVSPTDRPEIIAALTQLENIYSLIPNVKKNNRLPSHPPIKFYWLKLSSSWHENNLLIKSFHRRQLEGKFYILSEIKKRIKLTEKEIKNNNQSLVDILLQSIEGLLKLV